MGTLSDERKDSADKGPKVEAGHGVGPSVAADGAAVAGGAAAEDAGWRRGERQVCGASWRR